MFKETTNYIKSLYPTKDFIPLHEPLFIGNEKKYVTQAIDSTYVSSVGEFVNLFERKIAEYAGAKYAVAAVNGTAALHMALLVAGVKRNELVITQPLSFIATCNAISYIGAEPIFIDVDKKTLSLSYEKLHDFLKNDCELKNNTCFHRASGKKISACVPMHTFGHPAEVDLIVELCNKCHIPVVEDAAESIGSFYKNKHTGTFGLLGVFSFNGNKTITCGGGGAIITNDETLAKLTKHLTTQAKTPHPWEFNHDQIGYNYRMPNLNAALACAQLEMLETFVSNKRELAKKYAAFFETTNIRFFNEPENSKSNYWLNAILLDNLAERNAFLKHTNDHGVMTRPTWTLMNHLPMFKNCLSANLENAEYISQRLVNIPSSVTQ